MDSRPPISDLERTVMDSLWQRGKASAADIQQSLTTAGRPLKDSTIRTVLLRLEEKGYVEHSVDGRTFIYSCLERPGSIAARAVQQIVDRFCHGSLESLLAGMVENEIVDTNELQTIVDRLARKTSGKKERTKRK